MTIMSVLSDDEDACGAADLSPEEELLQAARSGSYTAVENLLNNAAAEKVAPNVDCKGTQKANLGWTPLHLACYFGHFDVAELLLQHGAYVDVINREGDTPLHKAAYTGRELQKLLMQERRPTNFLQLRRKGTCRQYNACGDAASGMRRKRFYYLDAAKVECDPGDEAAFSVMFPEDPPERLAVPPDENDKVDRMTAQAQQQLLQRGVDRATSLHASLVQLLDAHRLGLAGPCQELLSQWHELLLLSRSVTSSLSKCTLLLKQQEESRAAELAQERERSRVLQESLSVLAREHHQLECTLSNPRLNHIPGDESEDEFFDAYEGDVVREEVRQLVRPLVPPPTEAPLLMYVEAVRTPASAASYFPRPTSLQTPQHFSGLPHYENQQLTSLQMQQYISGPPHYENPPPNLRKSSV
ncbi:hypothetical protein HPB51_009480 [Rhipicephalus microplus]|uniref:Uncharacterized protein n=1 Tax=Rhipicephalus microplus TaxID=6941 RepID=A0A9J6DU54_RHIMP|nr:hypothetical protein HPB51_009480 [Rhipicephalus microplus]